VVEAGGQRFAWVLTAIKEIVPARAVTRLPGAPAWVLGLLNLRGLVLTVIDLPGRIGLVSGAGASFVVVEWEERSLGVRVDAVRAVAMAEDASVTPVEGSAAHDGVVQGMVRLVEGPAALIDAAALCRSVLATA
jgi:purine-binding chemotaxis protein CheW